MVFNCQRRSRTHRTLRRSIGADVDDIDAPIYQRGQSDAADTLPTSGYRGERAKGAGIIDTGKRARKRRRKSAAKREREAADVIIACIVLP